MTDISSLIQQQRLRYEKTIRDTMTEYLTKNHEDVIHELMLNSFCSIALSFGSLHGKILSYIQPVSNIYIENFIALPNGLHIDEIKESSDPHDRDEYIIFKLTLAKNT